MWVTLCVVLAAAMEVHLLGSIRSSQTFGIRDTRAHVVAGLREHEATFRRQPNYAYNGVATDPNENWCRHLATNLEDGYGHHKTRVTSCEASSNETCSASYQQHPVHGRGHFMLCVLDVASQACHADTTEYNCTWTALMEDLMNVQSGDYHECLGELLEAKRSMDGLEHAGEELREDLEYQNRIIQIQNGTIRQGLRSQQIQWATYIEHQNECTTTYDSITALIRQLRGELEELRAIALPTVRSAVNFVRDTGYQEEPSTATGTSIGGAVSASFVQMDATQCESVTKFLSSLEEKAGVKASTKVDCHAQREQLQTAFTQAFVSIIAEINITDSTGLENRSICFSEATYRYKYEVEGPGKIDDTIEQAARQIHEAQLAIARLEPRLHDVEHAAGRMDRYIGRMNETCNVDAGVSDDLKRIQNLIKTLQACPGRNDFTIDVPHWQHTQPTTPSPTPWHQYTSKVAEWEERYGVA